jgi:hypothetical protein
VNYENIGRAVGVACGLGCALLSLAGMTMGPTFKDAGLLPVIIPFFGVSGLLAAIAAFYRSQFALVALFIFSFLPFGAYLLLNPGPLHWFGVLQFGYIASLALLRRGRKIRS